MSDQCAQCPGLRAEIGRLSALAAEQTRRIEWLSAKLGQLRAAVTATVVLLEAENEHTTMPRNDLLANVFERLRQALIDLESRRTS